MSDWDVHLEFEEGTSSKFWRAKVDGKQLKVNYGRIGSNGQTQIKDFANTEGAKKEFDRLVREKRNKGYGDAEGSGGGDDEDDEDEDDEDEDDEDEDEDDEDEDEDDPPPKKKKKSGLAALAAAASRAGEDDGIKLVLDHGGKKVEVTLAIDGKVVRFDSAETYSSADAAKKALDRLKKALIGDGYKEA